MTIQHKTFSAEIERKSDTGGRIVISTATVDRDNDRVLPTGAILDNYTKNPVVMWGHSYGAPADLIGRAVNLEVGVDGITADFELRPAANEADPQNIVRLLWEGGWVRTASIGFRPIAAQANEYGGKDFTAWELLEFSLVPVPANAAALRLAAKALDMEPDPTPDPAPDPTTKDAAPDGDAPAAVVEAPADADGKQDDGSTDSSTDIGSNSEGDAPHSAPDAAAIEAAQELRLAAILNDFMQALRPYLAV